MGKVRRKHRKSLWQIFAVPLGVAFISLVGLLSALLGDGVLNWLSWVGLAIPVILVGRAMTIRSG